MNAAAPRVLAEEAARLDALLIHFSTDYVFNGEKPEPYLESDPVSPVSVYGASKAAGEAAIAETARPLSGASHQLGLLGSKARISFAPCSGLGAERSELRVVDDQVGAPTSAAAIAARNCTAGGPIRRALGEAPAGIYHMTAGGSTSWCGFARAIFSAGILSVPPQVQAIPSSDYPTPAKRPANSVLSNDKFAHAFGFRLPSGSSNCKRY